MATISAYDELLLKLKPRPIRTDADYRRALQQLNELMEPSPPKPVAMMVDLLASLVEQYESKHYPARSLPPSELLAELIAAREVTAADVSRATGVPRSAISNALASRRGISKANALSLAEFFRVPVSAFLQ